jgi:hypothetical protein
VTFPKTLPLRFVLYFLLTYSAMKRLTLLTLILCPVALFSQEQPQQGPAVSFSSANLSVGATYGIHPNLRNEYLQGFAFGEGDAALSVKGIPFLVSFRLSEEPYRSGRPSYFRCSFDAQRYHQQRLQEMRAQMDVNSKALALCSDSLHLLESKLSYWNLKKHEWETPDIPDIPLPDPDLPQPDLPDIPLTNPTVPNLTPDSINAQIANYEQLLHIQQTLLSELTLEQDKLKAGYEQLISKRPGGFFDGIRKFDIGLSTLSPGSLSRNAVPMQGIHIAGNIHRTFYDVAAGFTLPNQLFSNMAFDQLINNSSNVFNAGNFFAVNNVRFVSSAAVGYGEREKNAVVTETFYTGRSWDDIRHGNDGTRQTATNLAFWYTPKRLRNLTWNGSVGRSFSNDTIVAPESARAPNMAYSSGIMWLTSWKGRLKANYRNLGADYDGWSQGIFLKGAEHADVSYRQAFSQRFALQFNGATDRYRLPDSTQTLFKTRQAGSELHWNIAKRTTLVGNYTLLELLNDTLSADQRLSHLGKLGVYNHHDFEKWRSTASLDAGYAHIAGADSNQRLLQSTARFSATVKKWTFGLNATYSRFEGLSRIYGENWVLEPNIGFEGPELSWNLAYQQLQSEQFGAEGGFVLRMDYRISRLFTISYFAQRWLPTEYTFFMNNQPDVVKPIYMRWKITLHLIRKP